jgi:uncharacterized OB-fold protein
MSGPEAQFFDFLRQGRFRLQRTKAAGTFVFYPRWLAEDWEWVDASGGGTVYSRTVIRQKAERGGDYCIAIVELDEGPRLLTRVTGIPASDVTIGMRVNAMVEVPSWDAKSEPVVIFSPVN